MDDQDDSHLLHGGKLAIDLAFGLGLVLVGILLTQLYFGALPW